jgi:hypothetical protein
MSTYGLNKLIRDINRSLAVGEEYFKDQVSLLDRYALSVDERQAKPRIVVYEAVQPWATGVGIVSYAPVAPRHG